MNKTSNYIPTQVDLKNADKIARETAQWFNYTTGPMESEHSGQCCDYAVMFIFSKLGFNGMPLLCLGLFGYKD